MKVNIALLNVLLIVLHFVMKNQVVSMARVEIA
jgi:hypothetical protein